MLVGCVTNTPEKTSDTFCELYEPVYTFGTDTEKTKQQVDINNATFDELCKEK